MTEEQVKENISREFFRILAHGSGLKTHEPAQDHGVDMLVYAVTKRVEPSGKTRCLDSQINLSFQLKSTTIDGIVDDEESIKYDLEVKNYNDLIQRKDDYFPLYLAVIVLGSNPPACIDHQLGNLSLIGNAYWFLPAPEATPSANQHTVRITIPKTNRIEMNFMKSRFEELGVEI
jgi:hypothetical protein